MPELPVEPRRSASTRLVLLGVWLVGLAVWAGYLAAAAALLVRLLS